MARLEEVWATQQLTNIGVAARRLEAALRDYLGVRELSLFTNGTVALITAIRALDLTGEVLTTPFTFPATPHASSWSGITPVFCDIDPVTLTLDPAAVERAMTERTSGDSRRARLRQPVRRRRPAARRRSARPEDHLRRGARVRHAHPGPGIGNSAMRRCSAFTRRSCFTPPRAARWRAPTRASRPESTTCAISAFTAPTPSTAIGLNGKMSELHAALGLSVLEGVADELTRRRRLLARYRERFAGARRHHLAAGAERRRLELPVLRDPRRRSRVRLFARRAAPRASRRTTCSRESISIRSAPNTTVTASLPSAAPAQPAGRRRARCRRCCASRSTAA